MSAYPALALPDVLSDDRLALLGRLTDGLGSDGLWWLSGYAAGLARGAPVAPVHAATAAGTPVTVLYGSQTGNAARVAGALSKQLVAAGVEARLLRADAYPLRDLKDERLLYIVISTQGDGEPPDDARGFVEHLAGRRAPQLPSLAYAVLGLGDSSYPQFCAIARQLDTRLAELGASRALPLGEADLDIETIAEPWAQRALVHACEHAPSPPSATVTPLRARNAAAAHGRASPFAAEVLANLCLTGPGSARDVRHVELSLQGASLSYEPGDALGVWPRNPPALVDEVLQAAGLRGEALVTLDGHTRELRDWLLSHRELTRLTRGFATQHAERSGDASLKAALDDDAARSRLLAEMQPVDLLRTRGDWTAADFVAALRPLTPRLYSIASAPEAVGEEAHLTVAHVEYMRDGHARWGAASHFIAQADEGTRLPVFIEANTRFRLPADTSRDIVMIGPGTGVAPFRGFVQKRTALGATGRNWLLFGNRDSRDEFLYQLEWQDALRKGTLSRLDLAFSRERGAPRTYVQQRVLERGRELYAWLESGAHLYVCGATAMARDVHAALLQVLQAHGSLSAEDAAAHLETLRAEGRYARDVY